MNSRIARLIRLHERGTITGRELVSNVFDTLAHDGLLDEASTVIPLLLDRAENEVKEWVRWVGNQFQINPRWIPFAFGGETTPEQLEELSRFIRSNFERLFIMVKTILDQRCTESAGLSP